MLTAVTDCLSIVKRIKGDKAGKVSVSETKSDYSGAFGRAVRDRCGTRSTVAFCERYGRRVRALPEINQSEEKR